MKITVFSPLFAEADKMNQYAGKLLIRHPIAYFSNHVWIDQSLFLVPNSLFFFSVSPVDVTLDPATASGWLALSPDGKKVKHDCIITKSFVWKDSLLEGDSLGFTHLRLGRQWERYLLGDIFCSDAACWAKIVLSVCAETPVVGLYCTVIEVVGIQHADLKIEVWRGIRSEA